MERNRQFFVILDQFVPFNPPYGPKKSKFWKKLKKRPNILSFYKHKWESYDVWFLRYGVQRTEFFVILDHFLPIYLPNNPKIQNFEKMKKKPGDIILHKCTTNDMMYGSWDMKHDGENFFVILDHFLHFYTPKNPENQNFEKLKKAPGDIIILQKCTENHDHMLYCSLDMARNGFNCYSSFWAISCPFTSLTA